MADNPWSLADNPWSLADNPRSLADNPRSLADNPRSLADNPRGLADNPRGLADNPQSLADKFRSLAGILSAFVQLFLHKHRHCSVFLSIFFYNGISTAKHGHYQSGYWEDNPIDMPVSVHEASN